MRHSMQCHSPERLVSVVSYVDVFTYLYCVNNYGTTKASHIIMQSYYYTITPIFEDRLDINTTDPSFLKLKKTVL